MSATVPTVATINVDSKPKDQSKKSKRKRISAKFVQPKNTVMSPDKSKKSKAKTENQEGDAKSGKSKHGLSLSVDPSQKSKNTLTLLSDDGKEFDLLRRSILEMHHRISKNPTTPVSYTFTVDSEICEEVWIPSGFTTTDPKSKNTLTVNVPIAVTFLRTGMDDGYSLVEAPAVRNGPDCKTTEFEVSYPLLNAFYLFHKAESVMRDRWILNRSESDLEEDEQDNKLVPFFTKSTPRFIGLPVG